MSDKPSLEERLRSGEGTVSWINEPIDFTLSFAIDEPRLTAREIADRRWHMTPEGEAHERE